MSYQHNITIKILHSFNFSFQDFESEKCKIEFTVNGKNQGTAFELEKADMIGKTIYPHILSKNMGYIVNFGKMKEPLCITEQQKRLEKKKAFSKRAEERKTENKQKTQVEGVGKQKEETINASVETDIAENATKSDDNVTEESEKNGEPDQTTVSSPVEDDILQVLPNYTFIANLPPDQLFLGPIGPDNRSDCEVGSNITIII
jgi:heterogeneous nuclear ribonucleoprotein U-like protein 1